MHLVADTRANIGLPGAARQMSIHAVRMGHLMRESFLSMWDVQKVSE